jgi:hypothetical protein
VRPAQIVAIFNWRLCNERLLYTALHPPQIQLKLLVYEAFTWWLSLDEWLFKLQKKSKFY